MARKISKDEQALITTLYTNLPTDNFMVCEQVKIALGIAKKYLSGVARKYDVEDNMYTHALRVALDASIYAKSISESGFYRYDLVIIALLHDVIEDVDSSELRKDLEAFRMPNNQNKILEGIFALTNNDGKIAEIGKAKYMVSKFNELSKGPKEIFAIKLMDRIDNLTCLSLLDRTDNEQDLFSSYYLASTQLIFDELSIADYVVPNSTYIYYNELISILNKNRF